jgi:hypothetical protein
MRGFRGGSVAYGVAKPLPFAITQSPQQDLNLRPSV